MNNELSQQVAIKVEVLDVELTQEYNMGINWDAIVATMNSKFALQGNFANATTIPQTLLDLELPRRIGFFYDWEG